MMSCSGRIQARDGPDSGLDAGWAKLNRLWLLTVAQQLVGRIQMCLGVEL